MAYENRVVQSGTANSLPTGTDPLVDNTSLGDVQAIKILDPTAGSTTPLIGQKTMAGSMPVVLPSDQAVPTPTTAALTSASINAASSGDNTLISGTANQTIRVFKLFLVANAAVNIKFKDGASTDLTAVINLNAGGSIVLDYDGEPWFVTTAGNAFVLNLSAAQQVSGRVYYTKS